MKALKQAVLLYDELLFLHPSGTARSEAGPFGR
jgi:hypothetical protein